LPIYDCRLETIPKEQTPFARSAVAVCMVAVR
jgi:hypothetical protein